MPRVNITLSEPHENQDAILRDETRFIVVATGRRFGKTELAKHKAIKLLLAGKKVWWVAPTYKMTYHAWIDITTALRPLGSFLLTEKAQMRISMENGGFIEFRSTHNGGDGLRGAGLDYIIVDEAAFIGGGVWSQVLRPMLVTTKGGAMFLSSPHGRNWFYDIYKRGLDDTEPDWASYHFTSYDNPLIDPLEIDSARDETPERTFKEEYKAEFLTDNGAVFRGVNEVAILEPRERRPDDVITMGVDWGRDNDYTVVSVLDVTTNHQLHIERFNKIGYDVQRSRIMSLYERFKPTVITVETNSIGAVNLEELRRAGLPVRGFQTTSKSKPTLIEGLVLAIERGDITLLKDPVQTNELMSYEMERLPSGGYRYNAPSGSHDDTVIALALSWINSAARRSNLRIVRHVRRA